ncbi:nucleoside hydrolase [Nocardia sp. NBC_01499]|uniref:nucleoside hydrolase n=1 Tax=Nocardia sp. NBC_01499 TaxID=2903597 RepID=UPI00386E9342
MSTTRTGRLELRPFILDTDIGGEPDDALALVVAAGYPELSLVVTSDEHAGRRARLARHLLDLLGRTDVPVVAGRDLGNEHRWAADDLVPRIVPEQRTDVVDAIGGLLERTESPIGWIGIGALSNLADVIESIPAANTRLVVTQMGGSHTAFTDHPEPNFGLDLQAARTVLAAGLRPGLLPAEVTTHFINVINRDSIEYDFIARTSDPVCQLLLRHMDQWFDNFRSNISQQAPLTLGYGMGVQYVVASETTIGLDDVGRISTGDLPVFLARSADYSAFEEWFIPRLSTAKSTSTTHPAAQRWLAQVDPQPPSQDVSGLDVYHLYNQRPTERYS